MKACAILMVIIAIVALAWAPAFLQAEQCGSQAGGATCPNGLCCSRFGWCGNTAAYCSERDGCQSTCRCGSSYGGARCGSGRCCSIWGWCGSTSLNCCGRTCQSDCTCAAALAKDAVFDLSALNTTGTAQP